MEEQHLHCINCVSRRCMTRPETGVCCDLIGCPLVCGAVFHSCKAAEHRLLCPLERVPCLNSGFGCPFTVARNKITDHLEVCPASVVCCTMEWNRWPVSFTDRKSYENLSKDIDQIEQLDMALALQDQRMLLESLKVATMVSKTSEKQSNCREQVCVGASMQDKKCANGFISVDENSYSELYQATVETTKSLAAALDILNNATRDVDVANGGVSEEDFEVLGSSQFKQTVSDILLNVDECVDDCKMCVDDCKMGAVSGVDFDTVQKHKTVCLRPQQNGFSDFNGKWIEESDRTEESDMNGSSEMCSKTLCNGFHVVNTDQEELDEDDMDLDVCSSKYSELMAVSSNNHVEDLEPVKPCSLPVVSRQPSVRDAAVPDMLSNGLQFHLPLPVKIAGDRSLEREVDEQQRIRASVFAVNARRPFLGDPQWFQEKMEDKAIDTSDLEITEDPMGLQGIDLITAALLFCLGDSPGGRGISDSRNVDGYHIDFGTQTFSFPSAILATNTMVGEIASASACDHANPQLSNPSPFQTLGLDLVLECVARYQTKQRSMFTFVCGQLFRRDEFSSHFKNVHGDIHAGLNGWMEQRCPLAYYGCTYSQRRFCPSVQGSKIIHDRHLRSFGVQPNVPLTKVAEPEKSTVLTDHLSSLPFEILQHIAGFLDGFSLCQLSLVSRLMRDACASLLQVRGMVTLLWEKRQYPNGTSSWQMKDKVWRFSTAFGTVNEWKFAEITNMADHLKKCKFNTVEKREEAIPLPCMCVTRELTREGRSLRSVLKPVL
ncbi:F-box only protein 30 isoform X2 [Protopterus annectens]|nr:F-box only protein 30 isoform X2 [Protopterus annectens]